MTEIFQLRPRGDSAATGCYLMAGEIVRSKLQTANVQADSFAQLVETIVSGNSEAVIKLLDASPRLARMHAAKGATRQASKDYYFEQIDHYMYAGDTALHMAATSYQPIVVEKLLAMDADVRARNRRGAEPLHYAVDGGPGLRGWNPTVQAEIITMLIGAGADPNAVDNAGSAPLHRAVRNRCADAVAALIRAGADPGAPNKRGSTPMLLATRGTGRGGSGSAEAKEQQQRIVRLLAAHSAA